MSKDCVEALFRDDLGEEPDEAVTEFISSYLDDSGTLENGEALGELISCYSMTFAEKTQLERQTLIRQLISHVHAAKTASTITSTGAASPDSLIEALRTAALDEKAGGASLRASVAELRAMLGERAPPDDFLAHVLSDISKGQLEAAALWCLDHNLEREESTWRVRLLEEARRAEEDRRIEGARRKEVVSRFAVSEIKESDKPIASKIEGPLWKPVEENKNEKIRYLNGQVVTTKGEKIITLKDPNAEWDGGSRGRVKTKGKRGKGFA